MATAMQADLLNGDPGSPSDSARPQDAASQRSKPSRNGIMRIDLEPVYSGLKTAIGEHWNLYRESIGQYMMGRLNQEELSMRIDPVICANAGIIHMHNQLIAGIYSNCLRESPESEIASFVSSHDKPTQSSGKQVSGDAAEQRLKQEIMALPARERHRLKQLAEQTSTTDEFRTIMKQARDPVTIKAPDVVPTSAGGFNKTNWELEIGKRFEQPLFHESNEFPDADTISKRMVPMCYELGLAGGATTGTADLLNVATEAFVKQLLTESFRRVRTNGVSYVQTAAFRRRLARDEDLLRRGLLKRDTFGLLPVEQEVERKRPPFGVEDLRFSLLLGNSHVAQNKILAAKVLNRALSRLENKEMEATAARRMKSGAGVNGVNGVNGVAAANGSMGVHGGAVNGAAHPQARTALDDVLDEVLDVGL